MVNTKENVPRTERTNVKKDEIYLLKINGNFKK
jgi:hypothetical protein